MLHLNVGQKDRRISQLEEEITRSREIAVCWIFIRCNFDTLSKFIIYLKLLLM